MRPQTLRQYHQFFDSTPIAIAILHASNFLLEFANDKMLELWHRPRDIHGVQLLDFLPELADQKYPQHLQEVVSSNKPWEEKGAKVLLNRSNRQETVFMDYSYTPVKGLKNKITSVLVMATDTGQRELNRLTAERSFQNLSDIVMSAPMPMCIYKGEDFKVDSVNGQMLRLWECEKQDNLHILKHVFHNRVPYTITLNQIQYSYVPLAAEGGQSWGVCVSARIYKLI